MSSTFLKNFPSGNVNSPQYPVNAVGCGLKFFSRRGVNGADRRHLGRECFAVGVKFAMVDYFATGGLN
jgi:hypothetical protein